MGVVVVCVCVCVCVSVSVSGASPDQKRSGQHGLPLLQRCRHWTSLPAVAAWQLAPVASITAPAIRYLAHPLLTAKKRQNTKGDHRLIRRNILATRPFPFCPVTIVLSTISVIVFPLIIDLFPILSLPADTLGTLPYLTLPRLEAGPSVSVQEETPAPLV